ncbi:hypothetical protein [Pseudodesulfovibrio sp.]|uniref:hypothetical protein n=1 Tax=unclassified Pseudodesulfovibrio TaxID=2661612 RepID=UPI003AFFDF55
MISDSCGCMRYTYDVVVWRHYEDEFVRHQLVIRNTMNTATEQLIGIYLTETHPEYVPFSIISITYVEKHSVMLRTFCKWLYRACTRSADDAVKEWKQNNGMAV